MWMCIGSAPVQADPNCFCPNCPSVTGGDDPVPFQFNQYFELAAEGYYQLIGHLAWAESEVPSQYELRFFVDFHEHPFLASPYRLERPYYVISNVYDLSFDPSVYVGRQVLLFVKAKAMQNRGNFDIHLRAYGIPIAL